MQRRSFIRNNTLALSLTACPSWVHLILPSPFDMKLLRRNVGIFTEKGGTIGWLIQDDSIVVIDAQFKEQAQHLISEIRKQEDAPIRYLINTHHHGDHTSGNIAFNGIAKNVLAHANSKINQVNSAIKNGSEADQLYPDMTYMDRWQEKIGNEKIDIQYWGPAHTNGDSIIHFQEANIVHCGDLVFNRKFPYIDKGAGAMINNWIDILGQMQSYFDNETLFIFGHANEGYPVTGGKEELAAFADYLTALLEYVRTELNSGKSKEQILMATGIPGGEQWFGEGIDRSLNAAIQELMPK